MGCSEFFDLFASVIRAALDGCIFKDLNTLTEAETDRVKDEVSQIMQFVFGNTSGWSHDFFRVDLSQKTRIINWCREKNDSYLYVYLLKHLESLIDEIRLCKDFGVSAIKRRNRTHTPGTLEPIMPYFFALNQNYAETEIVLLPRFRKKYSRENEPGSEEKRISRMSEINEILDRIAYIELSDLDGLTLNQVIISPPNTPINRLEIGFTPTSCKGFYDLFYEGEKQNRVENGREARFMGEFTLKHPGNATDNYLDCLEFARKEKLHIMMASEMFGTDDLVSVPRSGLNRKIAGNSACDYPFLIVTPSQWKNYSNSLSVYSSLGELIGRQYKQFRFTPDGKEKEDLRDIPREILVIHVYGVGSFAFPICADLLDKGYRELIFDKLQIDFTLCSSYSFGQTEFEMKISKALSNSSYVVWCNSCSALVGREKPPGYIGAVIVPKPPGNNAETKIAPACGRKCGNCIFKISVHVDLQNSTLEADTAIEHFLLRKEKQ